MNATRVFYTFLLTAAILIVTVLPGCDNGAVTNKPKKRATDTGPEEDVVRVPVTAKAFGKISGKVVYDGAGPPLTKREFTPTLAACCAADTAHEEDNFLQEWVVDKNGGVKYAVVFLQPPEGKFFDIPQDQQKVSKNTIIDQPFCAFQPHVFVHYPMFYDKATSSQKETGQRLVISNSAKCEHNFNFMPGSSGENRPIGKTLGSGQKEALPTLYPQDKNVTITCNIHNWMRAYGFILEHPYAAVTDDKGNFVIENVPLGVELNVVGWHEVPGFFNGGEQGRKMTLQADQVLDTFKIKAR